MFAGVCIACSREVIDADQCVAGRKLQLGILLPLTVPFPPLDRIRLDLLFLQYSTDCILYFSSYPAVRDSRKTLWTALLQYTCN